MPTHTQDFSNLSGDFRNAEPGKCSKDIKKGLLAIVS
jgi:hypothetical protein